MACFFRSSASEFLSISHGEILARLSTEYAKRGYTSQYSDQTLTWERDLRSLREVLANCLQSIPASENWGILLEFVIPRKEVRIDAVLLVNSQIVIIEAKSGELFSPARHQLEEYALLLHYFHKASDNRKIVPILVSPEAEEPDLDQINQYEMFPQMARYWIPRPGPPAHTAPRRSPG